MITSTKVSTMALRQFKWWMTTGQFDKLPVFMPRSLVSELMNEYFNDKNSSSLREDMTLRAVGLEQNPEKLGYDATTGAWEVKPQNVMNDGKKKKLNGSGNFTDFTWARHRKYNDDHAIMLISGFVEGRLIYVFQFPYAAFDFYDHIEYQIERRFPDGDVSGQYLRSASFTFKHYKDDDNLKIRYLDPDYTDYRANMTKAIFNYLDTYDRSTINPPDLDP
jgi:hypothetical protein